MKHIIAILALTFAASSFAAQECAENNITATTGGRVTLTRIPLTQNYKAVLRIGKTGGLTYELKKVKPGVFQGSVPKKPQYSMRLIVSLKPDANRYINGYEAALDATFPTASGKRMMITTLPEEQFVCGKLIGNI